jgi:cell fate regulator YaaT (PSP1 superfamily)
LMCCLTYENPTYLKLKADFPKIGKTVKIKDNTGKVVRHNVIGKQVVIRLENGTEVEAGINDIES